MERPGRSFPPGRERDAPQPVPAAFPRSTGRGTYRNPVLWADYSDPDVVRVGDRWYLTASSFSNLPGLPVLSSPDLVHWDLEGYALTTLGPGDHYRRPRRGGGVWAPALRHGDGVFTIHYPDPDQGIFRTEATTPAGPWSTPVLVDPTPGAIDPCPFTDDDGGRWLVKAWAKSRVGFNNRITLHALDAGGRVADPGTTIVDGALLPPAATSVGPLPWITLEGPKLYKRDGWYYLLAPAGGVKVGWQGAFRAVSLQGPWEGRNVLDQGATPVNGPHQGALVDGPDGRWWFLHFQDQDSWGRVVHLQPVEWHDGWPRIGTAGRPGLPVLEHPLPHPSRGPSTVVRERTRDAGLGPRPGLWWQWQANPDPAWILPGAPAGALRLACAGQSPNPWENPALLTRKLEGPSCALTVKVGLETSAPGEEAGLAAVGRLSLTLGLTRREGVTLVLWRTWAEGLHPVQEATAVPGVEAVWLRLAFDPERVPAAQPPTSPWPAAAVDNRARASAWWSADGLAWNPLGTATSLPPGRWVGTQTGIYALAPSGTASFTATRNGHADFSEARWTVGPDTEEE